jgi:hypothetical protein
LRLVKINIHNNIFFSYLLYKSWERMIIAYPILFNIRAPEVRTIQAKKGEAIYESATADEVATNCERLTNLPAVTLNKTLKTT